MFRSWWLLVFPIAISQFTVFWNLITQRSFTSIPSQQVEVVSPLLAAFLSAHLLTAEYQSRIGSILASKPLDIGRVVLMRLIVVMAIVWGLGLISLLAYYFGQEHYDILSTGLAGMVSTLFLGLFALTFATLFRSPLTGFGIAALYWALDLPPGPPIHPFLSLRSLNSVMSLHGSGQYLLTEQWWIAKLILAAAAFLLYAFHARIIFLLGSPLTLRHRKRALAWAAAIFAIYLVSGGVIKVAFGYSHRGSLQPDDAAWFRHQFSPYGPIPISALFGPAFERYLGEIPNAWRMLQEGDSDRWGDTARHRIGLREVVDKMDGSLWAPGAAELYARLESPRQTTVDAKVVPYKHIIDRYADTPYKVIAQRECARIYADGGRNEEARAAYEALLKAGQAGPATSEALKFLVQSDRDRKDWAGAEKRAEQWVSLAPIHEKFLAYIAMAEIRKTAGNPDGAKQAAQQALNAARDYKREAASNRIEASGGQLARWNRQAIESEQKARAIVDKG
jgi:ABC-type transport system involved in multi-copper enzyme maturation permease subunit